MYGEQKITNHITLIGTDRGWLYEIRCPHCLTPSTRPVDDIYGAWDAHCCFYGKWNTIRELHAWHEEDERRQDEFWETEQASLTQAEARWSEGWIA